MVSDELPRILRLWRKPPRHHSRGLKACGARKAFVPVAIDWFTETIDYELNALAPYLHTPRATLTADGLLDITFNDLLETVKRVAPRVWDLFMRAASTSKQRKRNTVKDPVKVIIRTLALCALVTEQFFRECYL